MKCNAPDCTEEAYYESPENWCKTHWDEWWDCPCGNEIEGEANCDIHSYMRTNTKDDAEDVQ